MQQRNHPAGVSLSLWVFREAMKKRRSSHRFPPNPASALGSVSTVALSSGRLKAFLGFAGFLWIIRVYTVRASLPVVTAFASELQLVLGQLATDEKSNEITAIPELLDMFCRKGMIITIDAIGTQTDIAAKIVEKEADYVLPVKGNQETLYQDVSLYLDSEVITQNKDTLREKGHYEKTIEKGHGRIETRECFICPQIDWLDGAEKWAGLSGIGVIISKREELGKEPTITKNYFIYSLKTTTAADLLRIKRAHWAIENNLHWMLDVTFREDSSRARLDHAAENLNILRKEALQLMNNDPSKGSMRGKRLRCPWDIAYAFKLIGVN